MDGQAHLTRPVRSNLCLNSSSLNYTALNNRELGPTSFFTAFRSSEALFALESRMNEVQINLRTPRKWTSCIQIRLRNHTYLNLRSNSKGVSRTMMVNCLSYQDCQNAFLHAMRVRCRRNQCLTKTSRCAHTHDQATVRKSLTLYQTLSNCPATLINPYNPLIEWTTWLSLSQARYLVNCLHCWWSPQIPWPSCQRKSSSRTSIQKHSLRAGFWLVVEDQVLPTPYLPRSQPKPLDHWSSLSSRFRNCSWFQLSNLT